VYGWFKRYREKPQGLGTVSRGGNGVGGWLRERNELVRSMDLEREGVMVCENGACRDEFMDMGSVGDAMPHV
jgi:hypothetical protein